ncbi:MAG: 4-hydroxy-tetrahydrodipicolinate reductase [Candidatus Sabulitectum sp.]|nr:4-hydroxy-tetrahydrodipicolinate reductase [Candidatus Sabulitectum sp.]
MTKVAVFGADGRMGRLVADESGGRLDLIQTFDTGDELTLNPQVEVVIDFSLPSAWNNMNTLIAGTDVALVSGTTGLGEDERRMLEIWVTRRPVFYSSNMSVGIHVLGKLMEAASGMLGDGFDRELIEFHHRGKKDSPSGTALSLLKRWDGEKVYGRQGGTGERETGTVGVHAVRGGDVTGEHHLHFLGDGERVTISHLATDRRVFALGAIRAADFIAGKPPGIYGMEDMLG